MAYERSLDTTYEAFQFLLFPESEGANARSDKTILEAA